MNAVSKRTKIAVEDLNALERIVKQEEDSFEDFTNGLRFLSKAILLPMILLRAGKTI